MHPEHKAVPCHSTRLKRNPGADFALAGRHGNLSARPFDRKNLRKLLRKNGLRRKQRQFLSVALCAGFLYNRPRRAVRNSPSQRRGGSLTKTRRGLAAVPRFSVSLVSFGRSRKKIAPEGSSSKLTCANTRSRQKYTACRAVAKGFWKRVIAPGHGRPRSPARGRPGHR